MAKTIKEIRDRDQFFTKEEVSLNCIEITNRYVNLIKPSLGFTFYVEPSAGNGDFYRNLPSERTIAFDIEKPTHVDDLYTSYVETDFLGVGPLIENGIYIGNPPFGKRGKKAFDFILKCIDLDAAIIAFILPPNINTKLRLTTIREKGYEIVHIDALKPNSFYFYNGEEISDVSAESNFQIYMRKDLVEKTNNDIILDVNLKNNNFVQVYTINDNEIFNTGRDTKDKKFVQKGIGTK
jgi:hypothetical protein